ncbi:MAG: cation-transporting P-type ATPase, partial [Thiovulaceae bacterium]|nr:cation-transporting P-type ATPase [Sulfurimonadaceae bacterium]
MFYTQSVEDTLSSLECTKKGLSSKEAKERINHYGKNSIPEGKKSNLFGIFLEQFKSPIIYVLLIAAIISFVIKEFGDAGFILAVLFINAFIGTYQEYNANIRADALKKVLKTYVTVLRDEKKIQLLSEEITVGDIIFFESGIKVPADVRLIETNELEVNESLLTGESIDIYKESSYISDDADEPIGDRKNMLYAGSMVTKGRGIGVVTAVSYQSEIGKIALLLSKSKISKPPLIMRMEKFSLNISKIIGVVVLLIIAVGIYQQSPLKDIFFFTVAMAVSTIPEGLPVAITVALSVASASMSKRNVIVRKLSAIEGLGSCTLIASDKTGTMTENKLSVEHFITPDKVYDTKENIDKNILLASVLCNEAVFNKDENDFYFIGDQVDVALAKYALDIDVNLFKLKNTLSPLASTAYEPQNGYSAISYEIDSKKMDFIKGSPELILQKCQLDKDNFDTLSKQVDAWALEGFRNIAFAYRLNEKEGIAEDGYNYLGFAAIMDPLREGVEQAVLKANSAGIEVVMVTGDHPNTAFYISKGLGIVISKDEVMDGLSVSHWQERGAAKEEIANKRVFARVSPQQKQLIVEKFQALGHFVAVTGDGVNDAPALKSANIGISMGKSGT